ncbi:nucleotidyltransferase [Pseudonocardia sp. DR1-2]|uniref:nucleotidyltransferase domain-containing protein n=1 Tax=Pseudonocardia sp. DR1-2 TaxID=2951168 RepID=UPI0020439A93|nr:nucleotidyltransferase [Pseudonocardia sp. DR1-2]MCM3848777.1 nucleotidyltransferase [Pseudonocardia sp. DR1-2]
MPRTVQQAFDIFAQRLTPLQSQRDAAVKHRANIRVSLENKLSVGTFRETGSFTHGTGVRNYSDVDALVSINNSKPINSDTALTWVKSALQFSFPYTTVRVSRPAVVVEFAGGTETWEIIPGFLTARGGANTLVWDIPGAAGGWMDTAPLEHLRYVDECNSAAAGTRGGAKQLARFAKAWKYNCDVPISSFYLEMRAAQYMATQSSYLPIWDVCTLLEKLNGHQLASMNDPKGAAARFSACSSDFKRQIALSRLKTAATRARKALDAHTSGKPNEAFYYLNLLFGGKFPAQN